MRLSVHLAIAGVLVAGSAVSQAQTLPSSGSADLWLFVSDQTAQTTFAEDTGIALTSLLNTADLVSDASLSTAATLPPFTLSPSPALTSYINAANAAGDSLAWAVLGVQFLGPRPTSPINLPPGADILVLDAPDSGSSVVAAMTFPSLVGIDAAFNADVETMIATGYSAGGTVYPLSNLGGGGNVYGRGPDQSGIGLGTAVALYGLTGNGTRGRTLQSYILSENLTLAADGTLTAVSTFDGGSDAAAVRR